jgi:hypothetical protein
MASAARALAILAAIGFFPALALAQTSAPSTPSAPAAPAATPAGPSTAGPATAATDTSAPAGSAKPVVPATGYGWSTTPQKKGPRARALHLKAATPDAILPGFETLADGSTRLFVELSRPVPYDTKVAPGTITYVLKGTHVDRRNNRNPLVTVHFNTPVTSARLVPHGTDLWFVVDLRANVQPTVVMDAAKDGAAMLRIEFPKGDYLPAQASPESGRTPQGPAAAPLPPPGRSPAPATAPAAS